MKRLLLLVLTLSACGDNHTRTTPDARSRGDAPPPDAFEPKPRAVVVAGDYMSTGVLSKLEIEDLMMRQNLVASVVLGDPVMRHHGDELFVINRFGGNNVTILDARTLQLKEQLATGANSNPQDVAVVGNKLYVPALGTAGVVVLTRGSTETTTIDLSALDTVGLNDDMPECVSAYVVGTDVYVACGMLDGFEAVQPGKVAVIDSATDTLRTSVTMSYSNPYGLFERAPEDSTYTGDLLISTVPSFTVYATGCLQRITPGATPSAGCGLTNAEMGGFANSLSVSADGKTLYLAVGTYDATFNETGTLRAFDLVSGMLAAAPLSTTSQLIVDVAACPQGDVVASDKTQGSTGLRVWRGTAERTTAALSIGLPPVTNGLVCYDGAR